MNYELRHGSADFPLHVYYNGVPALPDRHDRLFYTHFHHHLEWIVVLAGKARFEIDTEHVIGEQGDLIMVNSGLIHGASSLLGESCEIASIVFDLSMLFGRKEDLCTEQFLEPFLNNTYALPNRLCGTLPVTKRIHKNWMHILKQFRHKKPGYTLKIKSALFDTFYELFNAGLYEELTSQSPKDYRQTLRLKQILDYMDANLTKKLTVQQLAEHVHISSAHFYTFFKSMTGQSPIEYLNNLRLTRAQSMLQTHQLTVQETAARVGFENVSYFIRLFKTKFGLTPQAFARSLEN
ncbi:AraC family transcriptional regulator [Xylanibacillus composti]|uniref:AraC family transcriptional regulator n=1 Tax=Xylanibacillus composti TaxID=1572762 RepID=A0A8J4H7G1_9BACL|nr:AraC family transcriptional regulator [Xylanibacillus composti]GIQ71116.1 AraC family transcriptional regulator [Xylanibacillus composti]